MAESTWARDVQVMEAVRALEIEEPGGGRRDQILERTGFDKDDVNDALLALIEAGFVTGRDDGDMSERFDWSDLRLLERGRRTVKQWPLDDPSETLVRLLDERIATTDDASERSRLEKIRDTVTDVGAGVLRGVLTDLLRTGMGM